MTRTYFLFKYDFAPSISGYTFKKKSRKLVLNRSHHVHKKSKERFRLFFPRKTCFVVNQCKPCSTSFAFYIKQHVTKSSYFYWKVRTNFAF